MSQAIMRVFELRRHEDVSGVSGTGVVAHAVEWPNGICTLNWATQYSSTAVYQSLDTMKKIHEHGGMSSFVEVWKLPVG